MVSAPDSVTYRQSVSEQVGASEVADWLSTFRPANPWTGMIGYATDLDTFEFRIASAWRHPAWVEGAEFVGPVNFGPTDYQRVQIFPSGMNTDANGSPQTMRVRRVGSDNTAGVAYDNLWVTRSSWVLTNATAPAGTRFNAVFDSSGGAGVDPGAVWNVLHTHTTSASEDSLSAVTSYTQMVRAGVPGGGKKGVQAEAMVIEARDASGASSATGGLMRTLELDLFCNGADDYAGAVGREVMPILLGKSASAGASPTITSLIGVYPVIGDGVSLTRGITFANQLNFSQSLWDTRDSVQGASANAIWLKSGHRIALDGNSTGLNTASSFNMLHTGGNLTLNAPSSAAVGRLVAPKFINTSTTTLAVTGASGTGATATLTYSGAALSVGSYINVSGMIPAAYNTDGAYVTASSSGSVSYASAATGAMTQAGTILRYVARSVNWTGKNQPLDVAGFYQSANLSGNPVFGICAQNYIAINGDTLVANPSSGAPSIFKIDHNLNTGIKGSRITHHVTLSQAQPTDADDGSGNLGGHFVVSAAHGTATNSDGGTALTDTDARGTMFAWYPQLRFTSGATNWVGMIGQEMDLQAAAGSSMVHKIGMMVVLTSGDAVQGANDDFGLSFNAGPAVPGWKSMIAFGRGIAKAGVSTTGSLIEWVEKYNSSLGENNLAANGVSLRRGYFSRAAFTSPGFNVGSDGSTLVGSVFVDAANTAINTTGSVGTAVTVATNTTGNAVGDYIYDDANNAIIVVDTIDGSGRILTAHFLVPPRCTGSPPANPITGISGGAANPKGLGGLPSLTLNYTWATRTALTLQSTAGQTILMPALQASTSYANDAAAAAGGVAVGQLYRNGSVVQIRIV